MWRKLLVALLAICLLGSAMAGCRPHDRQEPGQVVTPITPEKYGGVYRYPLRYDPVGLDPSHITDDVSQSVAVHIFNGLVKFDEHLNVIPDLATEWESSEEGLTWTFYLRKDAYFHDGNTVFPEGEARLVTAHDFQYSIERLLDPAVKSERDWIFKELKGADDFISGRAKHVAGIKVIDDYTLKLELEEPYAPFLSMLAMVNAAVVPHEAIAQLGNDFKKHPIGTGPFKFVEWDHDVQIVLQKNEDYFETGYPFLDQVIFRIIPEPENLLIEYETGNLEETEIPGMEWTRVVNDSVLSKECLTKPWLGTQYIGLNNQRWPFTDKLVRQAFNCAIDRQYINDAIFSGRYLLAKGVLPPDIPGYNEELTGYQFNQERARQLLSEAGFVDSDGDGIREKAGRKLEVEYLIVAGNTTVQRVAEVVASQLQEVGVRVNIKAMDAGPFLDAMEAGRTQMFRLGWLPDYPDPDSFLYVLFHSRNAGPAGNVSFYRNEEVDRLLDQAQKTVDGRERAGLYRQAEAILVEDAPWVFMFHYTQNILLKPYVQGRMINTMGRSVTPLTYVWLDKAGIPE
jgi:oligopeptide transport system substrate-binding protein